MKTIINQVNRVIQYFYHPQSSAQVAKERLQIIIAHERGQREKPSYMASLQKDLIDVIAKYVPINKEEVKVDLEIKEGRSILEFNVTLPNA